MKNEKHSKFDFGENLLIKHKILENMRDDDVSFEEWVNICFKERMEQILTDPREFGKIIINPIRRGYCLPEVDIH